MGAVAGESCLCRRRRCHIPCQILGASSRRSPRARALQHALWRRSHWSNGHLFVARTSISHSPLACNCDCRTTRSQGDETSQVVNSIVTHFPHLVVVVVVLRWGLSVLHTRAPPSPHHCRRQSGLSTVVSFSLLARFDNTSRVQAMEAPPTTAALAFSISIASEGASNSGSDAIHWHHLPLTTFSTAPSTPPRPDSTAPTTRRPRSSFPTSRQ
ncbi:hypothetical protein QBC39DRAFT_363727 [Podospora conica]|nr:hypothetical protein QBC39DRAFT_363727 [Schizothecium conicum]